MILFCSDVVCSRLVGKRAALLLGVNTRIIAFAIDVLPLYGVSLLVGDAMPCLSEAVRTMPKLLENHVG